VGKEKLARGNCGELLSESWNRLTPIPSIDPVSDSVRKMFIGSSHASPRHTGVVKLEQPKYVRSLSLLLIVRTGRMIPGFSAVHVRPPPRRQARGRPWQPKKSYAPQSAVVRAVVAGYDIRGCVQSDPASGEFSAGIDRGPRRRPPGIHMFHRIWRNTYSSNTRKETETEAS
jgi:hypothetical protein